MNSPSSRGYAAPGVEQRVRVWITFCTGLIVRVPLITVSRDDPVAKAPEQIPRSDKLVRVIKVEVQPKVIPAQDGSLPDRPDSERGEGQTLIDRVETALALQTRRKKTANVRL